MMVTCHQQSIPTVMHGFKILEPAAYLIITIVLFTLFTLEDRIGLVNPTLTVFVLYGLLAFNL